MDNDEIKTEYKWGELGKGVRGKYYARFTKGTNLVLLDDRVAKAFPTAADVNAALLSLLDLVPKPRITSRSSGRAQRAAEL